MGKLMDHLQKQLETEYKEDAKECIEVYNKLKEMNNGKVWSSQWQPLAYPVFKGFPSDERRYELTPIGKIFLKGIRK